MTTGPQDPAAAGRDRFRAGHADREQVIEALKDAFVQGRLTRDELDARVAQTLASRTHAELAALTADIPPAPAAAGPGAPANPGAPLAVGQGGRRVGRLPGHRGRRLLGRHHRRSGPPRPKSRSLLGSPDASHRPCRRTGGTRHPGERGGHLMGAETLPQAAAAPAGAGRPRPGRRPARRHRPWPGSPRPPPRPGPRRPAGSQVTAAPAAHSRPGGPGTPWRATGARRGMTPVKPAPGPMPPWLSRLGLTS